MNILKRTGVFLTSSFLLWPCTGLAGEQRPASVVEGLMGQDRGNGADNGSESVRTESWFSGTKPIFYCVERSADFPVELSVVEDDTAKALAQWVSFIRSAEGIYQMTLRNLDLNFKSLPKCSGREDLKFYFGTTNPEIEAARHDHYTPVEAIAAQTWVDEEKGWSKGFVWLAPQGTLPPPWPDMKGTFPDWRKDYQLSGILLHEVGHIFGSAHIGGTIMRSDIVSVLNVAGTSEDGHELGTDYFHHIDQQRMILPPRSPRTFPGALRYESDKPGSVDAVSEQSNFQNLIGRMPQGKIVSSIELHTDFSEQEPKAILHVSDTLGQYHLPIVVQTTSWGGDIRDDGPDRGIYVLGGATDSDYGRTLLGTLRTKPGKELQISLQINMLNKHEELSNNGPITVGFLDRDNVWQCLFQSSLIYELF